MCQYIWHRTTRLKVFAHAQWLNVGSPLGSSPYESKLGPGIGLTSQSKQLIIRFYEYLEKKMKEKLPNIAKVDVINELKTAQELWEASLCIL